MTDGNRDDRLDGYLDRVVDSDLPWESLEGTSVLVTGASGVVGSLVLATVGNVRRRLGIDVRVVATSRRPPARLPEGAVWVEWDVTTAPPEVLYRAPNRPGLVFHGAAVTASATMTTDPLAVFDGIVTGTRNILDLCVRTEVERAVVLSSVEAYGSFPSIAPEAWTEVSEDESGHVDLRRPRSSYPLGKRVAEHLSAVYAHVHGLPVCVVRPGQVIGPGVPVTDPRAPVAFAHRARTGQDILLRTPGRSSVNYCDSLDLMDALFRVAWYGGTGGTYTVVDTAASCSVHDLASLTQSLLGQGAGEVMVDGRANADMYPPESRARFGSDRIRGLGWAPRADLATSITDMVACWDSPAGR